MGQFLDDILLVWTTEQDRLIMSYNSKKRTLFDKKKKQETYFVAIKQKTKRDAAMQKL